MERRKKESKPLAERFWGKVKKGEGCWEWQGSINTTGYGQIYLGAGRRRSVTHRVSYELAKGPIPDGLVVMHSCDNPRCVNPDHLSVGTHADNAADRDAKGRNWQSSKTHCKNGHPLREGGFYARGNWRVCKACHRESVRSYYHKKKQENGNQH